MLGTHVFITVYGAIDEIYAREFGIRANEDHFRFSPSAPMMPKNFPCGAALKRTVTGLLEHGHQQKHTLITLRKIKQTMRHPGDFYSANPKMASVSFWETVLVYTSGVLLPCITFLLETYWGRILHRNRFKRATHVTHSKVAYLKE
ncbi:hypothetical protein HPB48_011983 [Haemaphysalis longicornis]|uniref:Uncharacterized protein n=1 Tax=Haemaphysalis longicornis TaxID=44386 RepID=A0A9J6H4H0_HAELO|nr:hypothetical protein HPB48_011983 [Haemaphysalis longicornis]